MQVEGKQIHLSPGMAVTVKSSRPASGDRISAEPAVEVGERESPRAMKRRVFLVGSYDIEMRDLT